MGDTSTFYRTHTCGQLRMADVGTKVTLAGFLENLREVGANLGFAVLRDFFGLTQIVIETEEMMTAARAEVAALKTKADAEIESERRKAASELKNDISELVLNIAGIVVEKEIDPSAHKDLIDDFISHVGDE